MKSIYRFTVSLCVLFLISCNGNVAYKEYDTTFVGNRWQKNDVKTFNFELKEAGNFDLLVDFSHVYGTQFAELPIKIVMINPDQSRKTADYVILLRDNDGKELGDCSGDYCDLREPVLKNLQLPAGNYQVSVANNFQYEFVPNVLGVGIRLEKSKD